MRWVRVGGVRSAVVSTWTADFLASAISKIITSWRGAMEMDGSGAFLTFSPDAFTTTDLTAGL